MWVEQKPHVSVVAGIWNYKDALAAASSQQLIIVGVASTKKNVLDVGILIKME
jgi:hypothetical protein